jgi:hypothetical protein
MALWTTQPLTQMSTRDLPGRKGQPEHKANNLTAICEPNVYKMREPLRPTTLRASMACYRNARWPTYKVNISDEHKGVGHLEIHMILTVLHNSGQRTNVSQLLGCNTV